MKKCCLNMIVKNEAPIIIRLFTTVLPIIDYWIISDTGSTDNTPQIIEEYFKEKGIPGCIHHHKWKNFGHNRDLALKCAQNSEYEFDYILLLDADMKLVIKPTFDKNKLTHDMYDIKQGGPTLSYYNTRIIRKTLKASCVCVTHEYYDVKGPFTKKAMDDLFIDDVGDGCCKDDKYERDIRLLKQGIEDEPDNVRYYFYLAQSYMCTRQNENAIKYYKERIARGGWPEEVWYSYYKIGDIYNYHIKDTEKAIYNYLMAYNSNPLRVENLYKLIKIYREGGQHLLAKTFIDLANKTLASGRIDEKEILFMEPLMYKYMIDFEESIISYYIGAKDTGLKLSNKLVLNNKILGMQHWEYELTMRNIKFYLKSLKDIGGNFIKKFDKGDLIKDRLDMSLLKDFDDYKSIFNPCISIISGKGVYINLRCSNYNMKIDNGKLVYKVYKDGELVFPDSENSVSSMSFLCSLNKDFNISDNKLLQFDKKLMKYDFSVKGVEDVRIFGHQKEIYLVGNSREVTKDNSPKMMLGKFNEGTSKVENLVMLHGYEDHKCQKNWSPFVHKDKLYFVYSFSPLIILSPDLETGKCTIHKDAETKLDYTSFRGGSPGFYVGTDLYFIIHEVVFDNGRNYYHRIVKMNANLEIEKVSVPFYFNKIGIEYVVGAVHDKKRDQVLISWGMDDNSAMLGGISEDNFRKFLNY